MNRVRALVCAWVVGLLAACGGGGGGDGGGFSIGFDRSSVTMSYAVGGTVTPATMTATARGTPPGPIFVGATTPSGQPDPNIQQVLVTVETDRTASVQIQPNPSLPVGTYRGTVILQACPDTLCTRHYEGSPFSVAYTITVTPGITLEPSSVELVGNVGQPVSQFVAITLPATAPSTYTATSLGGVVTIDQLGPTGFRVTGLAGGPGVRSDVIRVDAGPIAALLQVQFTSQEVTLRLDRASVALQGVSGASNGISADIAVTQLPPGASDFSVDPSSFPWLSVQRTPTGAHLIATSALPSGAYSGFVTVRAGTVAQSVPVELTLTAPVGGDRGLSTGVSQLAFTAAQGTESPGQAVGLVRPSWSDQVSVVITYNGSARDWLRATTLPNGDLAFIASAVGLPDARYDATIMLAAGPLAQVMLPVSFTVGRGLAFPPPQFVPFNSATPSRLTGSFLVTAEGPSTLSWRITACNTWLHPTRSTGVLGTAFEYEVDVDALRALPPGADLACQLVIEVVDPPALPPGGTPIAPVLVPIIAQRMPDPVTRANGSVVLDATGSRRVPLSTGAATR